MIKKSEMGMGKSREHTESKATMNDKLSISSLSFASSGWFCFQKSLHGPSLLVLLCCSQENMNWGTSKNKKGKEGKEKEQRYKEVRAKGMRT
jgi:hypothetical protein